MYKFLASNKFDSEKEKRIATNQWRELGGFRGVALGSMYDLAVNDGRFEGFCSPLEFSNSVTSGKLGNLDIKLVDNANLKIGEMYRELDGSVLMEPKKVGTQATLQRLLSKSQPVNIGKKIIESRRVGEVDDLVGRSMSGQTDIKADHTNSNYQGTIVPVFDMAYGRDWRDVEAQRSESFDSLSEDSEETEYRVLENVNKFLWYGDSSLKVKGVSWLGLKLDPSIATYSLAVDWSSTATLPSDILNDALVATDVLRISNNCTDALMLAVSPQIMTNWLRPTTLNTTGFGNILTFILGMTGGRILAVYEDSELSGNEVLFYVDSQRGLHSKTGMGMSSYALPRVKHNDPYDFIKWGAFGFNSKTTFSGKRCSLYGS